jgi:hypothetical protein
MVYVVVFYDYRDSGDLEMIEVVGVAASEVAGWDIAAEHWHREHEGPPPAAHYDVDELPVQ